MRLDKLLEKADVGSRTQVKKLIKSNDVLIDGIPASAGNQIVDTGLQSIIVCGKKIRGYDEVYYMLHKPSGVVTARSDAQFVTVIDLVDPEHQFPDLYPVGRLDRDTEGLVLITNNGPLGFRMLHPKHHVEKNYYVEVNGKLRDDACAFFSDGVRFLDGTICKAAHLEVISSSEVHSCANLSITEGKFHQVKKMFLAYGVKVTYLKRMSFGGFHLGNLQRGTYRELTPPEKGYLKTIFKEN